MIHLTFDALTVFLVVAVSSFLWHFLAPIARDLGRRTLVVDRRWARRREARRMVEAAMRRVQASDARLGPILWAEHDFTRVAALYWDRLNRGA